MANQWYTLHRYQLNYTQSQLHSLLSNIQQYGKHGNQLLNTYSFGYQGGHNNVRLKTANNGQGGSAEYQYGLAWIHDCLSCGSTPWRTGIPLRRPVDSLRLKDGNEAETYIVNTYAGVKGQITSYGFEYLGFGAHSQTTHTKVSSLGLHDTPEQRVETWYHQRTGNNIDPRRGRSYQQNIRAGVGDALIGYTLTTWGNTAQNGTNWVYKSSEERHTHAADGNTQNKSVDKTLYFYESTYGNLIRVEERNAANHLLRKTETEYFPNPNTYVVNKPARVRVYDGANTCVSETRYVYDGLTHYHNWPTKGQVSKVEVSTHECKSYWDVDVNWLDWIVTFYLYDPYGNVTDEWVHNANFHHIVTTYDSFYHLFPISRHNQYNSTFRDSTLAKSGCVNSQ